MFVEATAGCSKRLITSLDGSCLGGLFESINCIAIGASRHDIRIKQKAVGGAM